MIEAQGLTKRYAGVEAATDVSFRVAKGEVVGLLGPNGAGKTTVLRMLAGILTPSSGEATVDGHAASTDAFALKRSLGFLTGDTALYQRLSPREVLRYFGRLNSMEEGLLKSRIETLVQSPPGSSRSMPSDRPAVRVSMARARVNPAATKASSTRRP